MFVYVGAYTSPPFGRAEGISVYRLDEETGSLSPVQTVNDVTDPSFLALSPDGRTLFAASETDEGEVRAFSRDPRSGGLTPLNAQPSHGAAPCYVSVHASGRYLFVANYSGGTVASFPIGADGTLGPAATVLTHQGSSINPERQGEPHPHMISPTPDGNFVLATDLGSDRIEIYQVSSETGELHPNTAGPAFAMIQPGSGPRHFTFAPDGKTLYLINELASTLSVLSYDPATGAMEERQTVSTLPDGFDGVSHCAHVLVSPDGRFVYGSNRGHDSLAIFAVNSTDGTVTPIGHESTRGETPRNFGIDPSGTWLLAANQDTDTIVTFRRDAETGALTALQTPTASPSPVAIVFVPK